MFSRTAAPTAIAGLATPAQQRNVALNARHIQDRFLIIERVCANSDSTGHRKRDLLLHNDNRG
jgi:hypothetical protein